MLCELILDPNTIHNWPKEGSTIYFLKSIWTPNTIEIWVSVVKFDFILDLNSGTPNFGKILGLFFF